MRTAKHFPGHFQQRQTVTAAQQAGNLARLSVGNTAAAALAVHALFMQESKPHACPGHSLHV